MARYDPSVATPPAGLSWLHIFGGPADEVRPYAIAPRLGTHVVAGGLFRGDFDAGFGRWGNGDVARDMWLVGLDPDGALEWGTALTVAFGEDDPRPLPAPALAVGPGGEVYAAGSFRGRLRARDIELTSAGDYDFFVIKLTP